MRTFVGDSTQHLTSMLENLTFLRSEPRALARADFLAQNCVRRPVNRSDKPGLALTLKHRMLGEGP